MDLKETKADSEPIYEGSFVSINRDIVKLANGNEGRRIVIRYPRTASVLAETENGEIVLVRQWRYAVGEAVLELPAGKLDVTGGDPAKCVLRELTEGTSYTAGGVKLLHTFYTTVGFCDEKMYLYQTQGVYLGDALNDDENEIAEAVLMNREAAKAALENDKIHDAKTLVGPQYQLMHTR